MRPCVVVAGRAYIAFVVVVALFFFFLFLRAFVCLRRRLCRRHRHHPFFYHRFSFVSCSIQARIPGCPLVCRSRIAWSTKSQAAGHPHALFRVRVAVGYVPSSVRPLATIISLFPMHPCFSHHFPHTPIHTLSILPIHPSTHALSTTRPVFLLSLASCSLSSSFMLMFWRLVVCCTLLRGGAALEVRVE
jgi:hypothetical protein